MVIGTAVAGCGLQSASGAVLEAKPGAIQHYDSLDGTNITVAAKDFTGQLVLGNMLSIILAAAGADVINLTNTPGSFAVQQALISGNADIVPAHGHRLDQLSGQRAAHNG